MSDHFTAVQNFFRTALVKAAEDAAITPDYKKDSRGIALDEVEKNKKDQRAQLSTLLHAAKGESNNDTKTMDKALPEATDKSTTDTSNALLKIAMNRALFAGLRSGQAENLRIENADTWDSIYTAFHDELGKIA